MRPLPGTSAYIMGRRFQQSQMLLQRKAWGDTALGGPHVCHACAQGFKGMKSLVLSTLFNCLDMRGSNPLWSAVGYAGAPPPVLPPGMFMQEGE